MTRNKFITDQVVRILKEAESCREKGITKNTFSAWKAKFSGMDIGESKRPT